MALAIAISLSVAPARSADHVLFVTQEIDTPEFVPGEAKKSAEFATSLHWQMNQISKGKLEASYLLLESLDQFPRAVRDFIKPGDSVSAVVFIGHGGQTSYSLAKGQSYSGTELARVTHSGLQDVARAPELVVYFAACSCGVDRPGQSNLQTDFLSEMQRLNSQRPQWTEVHTIAHQDLASLTEKVIEEPHTRFHDKFFNSGLGRQYWEFDMKLFNTYGRDALKYRKKLKVLLTGIAAGTSITNEVFQNRSLEQLKEFAGTVGRIKPVIYKREKVRTAQVGMKTLGEQGLSASVTSTVYTALQSYLRPGPRCRDIFRNH